MSKCTRCPTGVSSGDDRLCDVCRNSIVAGLAIRFDGPPGPECGRFIEAEVDGASVSIGEWRDNGDGTWSLVLGPDYVDVPNTVKQRDALLAACKASMPFVELWARHSSPETGSYANIKSSEKSVETIEEMESAIKAVEGDQ